MPRLCSSRHEEDPYVQQRRREAVIAHQAQQLRGATCHRPQLAPFILPSSDSRMNLDNTRATKSPFLTRERSLPAVLNSLVQFQKPARGSSRQLYVSRRTPSSSSPRVAQQAQTGNWTRGKGLHRRCLAACYTRIGFLLIPRFTSGLCFIHLESLSSWYALPIPVVLLKTARPSSMPNSLTPFSPHLVSELCFPPSKKLYTICREAARARNIKFVMWLAGDHQGEGEASVGTICDGENCATKLSAFRSDPSNSSLN
ncbi:hypothetical protein B0T21DRAFT_43371 [Apiosordaria backusii]|uniref:Uncharacterized protein n=1 Tax=Apiosordaria backusii TaxID=314023 RepID=A0AA40AXF1_9PEZI|nr:hypothetical protein B0T21DRAFT_43371 [Apiosordaria backusii]